MTLRLCLCVRASRLELQAENPHTFSVAYASQFSIEKLQAEIIRTSGHLVLDFIGQLPVIDGIVRSTLDDPASLYHQLC